MAIKKTTPKKRTGSRKPTGKKPDTTRFGDFEKMIQQTEEEVEQYLLQQYKEEDEGFDDLPTPKEIIFCDAYMSNGFKQGPAIREVFPELASANAVQRAHDFLGRERVQKYLARQLHNKRLKMGITQEWICKKYLYWATLDITQFITLQTETLGKGRTAKRRSAVYLKDGQELDKLPPLVRQSIKSLTVDDKGKVKIEFIDQKSALDSLAKMMGYANDKLTIEGGKTPVVLNFDDQDKDA